VANSAAAANIFGQTVAAGTIATVAGPPGIVTFSGDGGPATSARFFSGGGLVCDHQGGLYLADNGNNRVRKISPEEGSTARTIDTIAGNGAAGYSGVPGPATAAQIQPGGLALQSGDLYVTNNATRVLELSSGSLTLIANATGASTPPSADGTPAVSAHLGAASIAFDHLGNMYAGDSLNNRIWKIDASGDITSIAGGGTVVLDGITVLSASATQAKLFGPGSIAFDPLGNLYAVDGVQNRILQIMAHAPLQPLDGTETVTIFAGTGERGFAGDGGPANKALLNGPGGLVFDTTGALYFSDGVNFRIRRVGTNRVITTIAGNGTASFTGDGGPALAAEIRGGQLAFDGNGNLFLMDSVNNVIRVLDDEPPVVRFENPLPAPNGHGWHNTTVAIPFTASDTGAGVASTSPSSPLALTAEGTAVSGTVTATDRAGNTASFSSCAVKIDKQGPVISGMPKTGLSLSPPDGRMVHVATVTASDDLSGVVPRSLRVTGTSNEPPDSEQISIHRNGHGGFEVWLQAARSASGSGRAYTLTAEAMDRAGNVTTVSAVCLVPK
jgi:sugar lactone lactonase YvrE